MTDADALVEELQLWPSPSAPSSAPSVEVSRPLLRGRHRDRDYTLRRWLLLADLLGLWLALALALTISGGSRGAALANSLWILPILPFWDFLFWAYLLYQRPIRRFEPTHLDDVSSLFHALIIGTLGLWFFYKLAPVQRLDFEEVLIFGLVSLPLIAGLRMALRVVNLRLQGPEQVFAVAPVEDVTLLRRKLESHPEYAMALVGAVSENGSSADLGLPLSSDLEDIEGLMASGQIDHLIVRLDANYISQEQVRELMQTCHREGVRFGCFPGVKTLLYPGTEINHIEGMGILTSNPPVLSRTASAMKRCLDVAVSGLLLALLALPMALIALAVKLDSKGGALYRQVRVGKDGRRFELIKFRSMVPGADSRVAELMAHSTDPDWLVLDEDPRVTRVGRFLRRTSLDELPQLWNVLRGDMSLVGPRPLPERDDEGVRGWERHRLDLVPGITGYWQVLGRNNIPFQEMLEIDYAYVASWSLLHDLKLLLRTVPVVLLRRGAN